MWEAALPETGRVVERRKPAARARPAGDEPVLVQIMGEGFLDVLAARDISASGMSIVVPHRFEDCDLDRAVELVVTLPGERPFMTCGRIVHRTKTAENFFGVEFENLSRDHRKRITSYVRKRCSRWR